MEILILIDSILHIAVIVSAFYFDKKLTKIIKEQNNKEKVKEFKRTHSTTSQSNFGNILNGRTNVYEKYQNKDGLYEPIQGKAGISLNNKEKGE